MNLPGGSLPVLRIEYLNGTAHINACVWGNASASRALSQPARVSFFFFSFFFFSFFFFIILTPTFIFLSLFLRQRQCEQGRGREREGERESQAGSALSAQSPRRGSSSQTVRPELKPGVRRLTKLSHPGASK